MNPATGKPGSGDKIERDCKECKPNTEYNSVTRMWKPRCKYTSKPECEEDCKDEWIWHGGSCSPTPSQGAGRSGGGLEFSEGSRSGPHVPSAVRRTVSSSSPAIGFGFLPSGSVKAKCACESGFEWQTAKHLCGCSGSKAPSHPRPYALTQFTNSMMGVTPVPRPADQGLASAARQSECGDPKCSCNPTKLCVQTDQTGGVPVTPPGWVPHGAEGHSVFSGNDFYVDAVVNNIAHVLAPGDLCAEPCTLEWWECHNESFKSGRMNSPTWGFYWIFEAEAFKWQEYVATSSFGRSFRQVFADYKAYADRPHRCPGTAEFTLTDHPGMTGVRPQGSPVKRALWVVRLRGSGKYRDDVIELSCKQEVGWLPNPFPFGGGESWQKNLWCTPSCGIRKKIPLLERPPRTGLDAEMPVTLPPVIRYCE